MAIVQCEFGHFFDDVKYAECPHCGNASNPVSDAQAEEGGLDIGDAVTAAFIEPVIESENLDARHEHHTGVTNYSDAATEAYFDKADAEERVERKLAAFVHAEEKTVGFFQSRMHADPVVGWLVCVDGLEKGRDYRLHTGRNFAGRSHSMDIAVPDDIEITRERHCSLVFDPRSVGYTLVPGEGTATYLNGELLSEPAELHTDDTVRIGGSDFVFIAFCNGSRKWLD